MIDKAIDIYLKNDGLIDYVAQAYAAIGLKELAENCVKTGINGKKAEAFAVLLGYEDGGHTNFLTSAISNFFNRKTSILNNTKLIFKQRYENSIITSTLEPQVSSINNQNIKMLI